MKTIILFICFIQLFIHFTRGETLRKSIKNVIRNRDEPLRQENSGVWESDDSIGQLDSGMGSASVSYNKVWYVFGGELNEDMNVYTLDIKNERFDGVSWKKNTPKGLQLAPRYNELAVAGAGDYVYLFGGKLVNESKPIKHPFVRYNINTNTYEKVPAAKGQPDFGGECQVPKAVSYDDTSIFVWCSSVIFNDNMTIYKYDTMKNAFEPLSFPNINVVHSDLLVSDKKLYFFGGMTTKNPLWGDTNAVWELDVSSSGPYEAKLVKKNEDKAPYDADGCNFVQSGILFILSATPDEDNDISLYSMSLISYELSKVKNIRPGTAPSARHGAVCGGLNHAFSFSVAGGASVEQENKTLKDTWTFHLLQ